MEKDFKKILELSNIEKEKILNKMSKKDRSNYKFILELLSKINNLENSINFINENLYYFIDYYENNFKIEEFIFIIRELNLYLSERVKKINGVEKS